MCLAQPRHLLKKKRVDLDLLRKGQGTGFSLLPPSILNYILTRTHGIKYSSVQSWFLFNLLRKLPLFSLGNLQEFLMRFYTMVMMYFLRHFSEETLLLLYCFFFKMKTFRSHLNPSHFLKNTVVNLVKAGGAQSWESWFFFSEPFPLSLLC